MNWLSLLWVFLIGGLLCAIGQVLVIRTKMTTTRILILYLLLGVFLEAFILYDWIADFARAGIKVPIIGFGASLASGAIEAVKKYGWTGIFTGGLANVSAGISAAVIFAFIFSLIFRSKSKR